MLLSSFFHSFNSTLFQCRNIMHKLFHFREFHLTHFPNKTEIFYHKTTTVISFSLPPNMPNIPWRNHNPMPCISRKARAWKSIENGRLCRCFRGCSVLAWQARWPCGLVGPVPLWWVCLNGILRWECALLWSLGFSVGGFLALPTSNKKRRSPFVLLLINTDGSAKPLNTNKHELVHA